MATPSLRLAFVKGPRDGDTLQYNPGSTIRVGRIVRGNEIAVKDAGISTKHLRIASVSSGNWVIQDLGSSNGTLLNSDALESDTPVDLRHGDIIELGEYTSVVVNFVNDVQEQKLPPPRPRRNNRRQANADPDPVQVKPAGKRTRVSDISEEENGLDVKIENKPSFRVRKARKIENSEKLGLKEEELLEEKKGISRVRRARNVASIQSSCVNSIEVEVGNSGKGAKNSKSTKSKKAEIVEESCFGLVNVEKDETVAGGAAEEALKEKRITRASRSKKNEIVGDSYLELEMGLKQARKSRGKNKKAEQKPLKSFEDDEHTDAGEQDRSCHVEEDVKTKSVDMVDVDLRKMTLGEFLGFLEVHLRKQINHKTESMIEAMRSKTQRVHEYIAEQRKVEAKAVCVLN